jgi:ubiquinone/menaquinone biosynthesis C-methylase UbiE
MAHLRAFGRIAIDYSRLVITEKTSSEECAVRAAYRVLLGREPYADELNTCTDELRSGSLKMGGLLYRLVASAEYQPQVTPPADPQIKQPATDPVIAQAYATIVAALPADASHEQFIRAAYQTLLRRLPDATGQETSLADLNSGTSSREMIVGGIINSPEYQELSQVERRPTAEELYQQVVDQIGPDATDEEFLKATYPIVLQRSIDLGGLTYFSQRFERQTITRQGVIEAMMLSGEYQRIINNLIDPSVALHQSRMMLIQQYLPPAKRILDLGGAAHDHDAGALLMMGYPHRPEEIVIIDLPPDDRIGKAEAAEKMRELTTSDGIHISYLYRSMADLADIADASFDLIVSGETIEHISEADGAIVCREAFRILTPGGSFCLDTPNGALTRLQSPDEFIHPEHQKEYLVQEIRDLLTQNGFDLVDQKALCPMPESLRNRQFDIDEIGRNIGFSEQPEEGYLFYIHAVKPA